MCRPTRRVCSVSAGALYVALPVYSRCSTPVLERSNLISVVLIATVPIHPNCALCS